MSASAAHGEKASARKPRGTQAARRAVRAREVLFGAGDLAPSLPVCDHYAGVEARMRKSLELQREMGPVFDVTLDCEDGAPVGGEAEHAHLVAELVDSPANLHDRVGARLHPAKTAARAAPASPQTTEPRRTRRC